MSKILMLNLSEMKHGLSVSKIDPPASLKLENVDANKTRKLLLNRRELKLIQDSIQKRYDLYSKKTLLEK